MIIKRIPIRGRIRPLIKLPKPKSKILCVDSALFLIVSGKKKIVSKRATRAIAPEAKNEAPKEIFCASKLMAGPNIKPEPRAALKIPKPSARFSRLVTSEITA